MKRITFNLPTNERGTWLRVRDESDKITLSLKSIQGDGKKRTPKRNILRNK